MIDKAKLRARRKTIDFKQSKEHVATCCWCGSPSIYAAVEAYCDHETKIEKHSICSACVKRVGYDLEKRIWNPRYCRIRAKSKCRVTHVAVIVLDEKDSEGTEALAPQASGTQVDVAGTEGRLDQGTQGFEGDRDSHVPGRGNAVAMSQVEGDYPSYTDHPHACVEEDPLDLYRGTPRASAH
jgi:hypothetical protein